MPDYIEQSKNWVGEFVVKNHICPFAREPFEKNKIDWKILTLSDSLVEEMKIELRSFTKEDDFDTKFLIIPELGNFEDYVEVFYFCKEIAQEIGINSLQFVSFHPESRYGDTAENDAVNFANRSPFPMIQLLRNKHLESLNLSDEEKDEILEHNRGFLENLGYDKLLEKLNGYQK